MTSVGITGSGGFLGGALAAYLRAGGTRVVELRRDGPVPFTLEAPVDASALAGLDALVHAAWDLRATAPSAAWSTNVEGSRRLVAAASAAGVGRIVFVSSMSAYFGTRQQYGLTKLAVERTVLEAGGVVARPGLVYGPDAAGMFGTLRALARLPVLPSLPGARQFTTHLDDVVTALASLATAPAVPSGIYGLAHPTPVPFDLIMTVLAHRRRARVVRVPVPWPALLAALRLAQAVRLPLPVRPDSLLGLVRPAPAVPGIDLVAALRLNFKPFPQGLY